MKVIIRDLIGSEVGKSLPFSLEIAAPKFEDAPDLIDVKVAGQVEQLGDRWLVRGVATATATLQCVRCLKEFEYSVDATFAEEFARKPSEDQFLAGDSELELTDMLRTVMLLTLPVRPLHAPNCRGLCDVCGKDLNEEPHDHPERGQKENPFSKLKETSE